MIAQQVPQERYYLNRWIRNQLEGKHKFVKMSLDVQLGKVNEIVQKRFEQHSNWLISVIWEKGWHSPHKGDQEVDHNYQYH